MVTRETSYIGQLYFGLSTDDTADIAEWHNGDRILLMDIDEMYVFDEATPGFKQISMGGGGGGGGGGGFRLLGSGTYTQTASLGQNSLDIPISITGTFIEAYAETDPQENVLHTIGWARAMRYNEMLRVDRFTQIIAHFADNSIRRGIDSTMSGYPLCLLFDAFTNPTLLTLRRWGSTCPILPGEFRWYIWGE